MAVSFEPLKRPPTPPKTAWFEFLLNPSSLETHLKNGNAEPSASELIAVFLYQAELAAVTAREISKNAEDSTCNSNSIDNIDNKKIKALKILALKVASFQKWKLTILEKSLPLATVENILVELLSCALPGVEPIAKRHVTLDLKTLTTTAIFSVIIYHRWSLRTAINDVFPVKPSKVPNIQVPGLLDPSFHSALKKESLLQNVKENLEDSVKILEQFLSLLPSVTMPTSKCFTIMGGDSSKMTCNWDHCLQVPELDIKSQISYELGMVYFHKQEYLKACDMFMETRAHQAELRESDWCEVDWGRLEGYCCACSGMLGRPLPEPVSEETTLVDHCESIRAENFEGLTSLLMKDNQKCVLSISYRESLEEDVISTNKSKSLTLEVRTCNMIRKAMEGSLPEASYIQMLTDNKEHLDFLIDVASSVLNTVSVEQKQNLKSFIRYLSNMLPKEVQFTQNILSDLKVLFIQVELDELTERWMERKVIPPSPIDHVYPQSDDQSVQVGELEYKLLVSYDTKVIRSLVQQLLPKVGKYQVIYLTEKWHLPKDLTHGIETLPVPQQYYSVYLHVLVAKARVATQQKMFSEAQELLQAADMAIKDLSYKLSKLLRWDILIVDLLHYNHSANLSADQNADLLKRCKACVNSVNVDQELQSNEELLGLVAQYLLNQRAWDFLLPLSQNQPGCIQLAKLIGGLCKELPQFKSARKFARELWESVTMIFANGNSQRKGNGPTNRDINMGLLPQQAFTQLCSQFKDMMVLSVILSLLAKLYNVLKDDLTVEITSEYLTLWPTTLANASSINLSAVTETLMVTMETALKHFPLQPAWIRTLADIHYANNQYRHAMKYYLNLGIILSDYFSRPITKNIYDENIYRRMMRCCNYLQCHSQIVVLCQFFDEPDYAAAFKAIQERNVHDAMDTYYECIWDITLLEYLLYHHNKQGELDKKQEVMKFLSQMELNSSNPTEILFEAAKLRKAKFLRAVAREYSKTLDV